jgi:hypothetical protein
MPIRKTQPATFRVDRNNKSREHLLTKVYRTHTMTERCLLALDADGLEPGEKAVLHVLACRCSKKEPNRTFVGEKRIAERAGISYTTVKRSMAILKDRNLIKRYPRGTAEQSWWAEIDWHKVMTLSYRWQTMLACEQGAVIETKPAGRDDVDDDSPDEDLSDLSGP